MLERLGYEVTATTDAVAALQLISEHLQEVIDTDLSAEVQAVLDTDELKEILEAKTLKQFF